jgi:hypothetical protein
MALGVLLCTIGFAAALPKDTVNVLTDKEKAQGYRLLFDSTLASFSNNFFNYAQNDSSPTSTRTISANWRLDSISRSGTPLADTNNPYTFFRAIVTSTSSPPNTPAAPGADVRSRVKAKDMELRFEYRNTGNQGIYYRFNARSSTAWNSGMEVGIENSLSYTIKQAAGSAYDVYPPTPLNYKPFATKIWNTVRIIVIGDSVEHWMNGVKIVGFRYWTPGFTTAVANSKWAGNNSFCQWPTGTKAYIREGFWGLQGDHDGGWQMRKIRLLVDSTLGGKDTTVYTGNANSCLHFGAVDTTCVFGSVGIQRNESRRAIPFRLENNSQGIRVLFGESAVRSVELYDLGGRLLRSIKPQSGSTGILLSHSSLHNGIYFVRIDTPSGVFRIKALVQ